MWAFRANTTKYVVPLTERSGYQCLPLLQTLRERAQIRCGDLHLHEGTGLRIEDALLHDVRLERALSRTERVAATVSRRTLLAGHLADSGHRAKQMYR